MEAKKKLKIAIVLPSYKPVPDVRGGGVEHLVTQVIMCNEKKRHVDIDAYTIADKALNNVQLKYTTLYRIKKNALERFLEKLINKLSNIFQWNYILDFYDFKVVRKLEGKYYDYIVVENNMYLYKTIYKHISAKFIFHLHNDIGKRDKPITLCKFIANTAEKIITCSDYLKRRLSNYVDDNNVFVLTNGVDFKKFYFDKYKRMELRKKYNLGADDIALLYIGRIAVDKGIVPLMQSFIKNANAKIKLFIIGDMDNGDKYTITHFQKYLSICSSIFYVGKINNDLIYQYISMADCVVIPTIVEEAFGLAAIEAFACSRAVLASNSGGLMDIVDSDCGFIFDKNNFETSFLKSLNVVKNKKDLKMKGLNGYNKVVKDPSFDLSKYYDNFIKILYL